MGLAKKHAPTQYKGIDKHRLSRVTQRMSLKG
jgi:hypothetical protein